MRIIELDDVTTPRQQTMRSRSLEHAVYTLADMAEAVSTHATRVAEKARQDASLAGAIHVFAYTSPHRKQDNQYSASTTVPLVRPTADTRLLASAALRGLQAIYREGYRYEKTGVMLVELQPDTIRQSELDLLSAAEEPKCAASRDLTKLMGAMDKLNSRYGKGFLQLGSSSVAAATERRSMKSERRPPQYTTVWTEMPVLRA